MSLGGGTVRSASVPDQEFRAYEIDAPPSESLPAVCSEIEEPLFFLNTTEIVPKSTLGEWFDSYPVAHTISGKYEETPVNYISVNPRAEFDGLIFIEETTAAEMLLES